MAKNKRVYVYLPICLSGEHRDKFPGSLSFRTAADNSDAKMKLGEILCILTREDGLHDPVTEATYRKFTRICSNYAGIRMDSCSESQGILCVYNYLSVEYGQHGSQGLVEVDCRL